MPKTNSKAAKPAPRSKKAVIRKPKPAPRGVKTAPRSAKPAIRSAKSVPRSAKPAPRSAKTAPRSAKTAPRGANALKKAANIMEEAASEFSHGYETRFKPEYLGNPYVLNTSVPNYMPTNEADLIDWIRNYLASAETIKTEFPNVFNITSSPFALTKLQTLFTRVEEAREAVLFFADYTRSWRSCSRILLHATEYNQIAGFNSPPAPPAFGEWTPAQTVIGLVGLIDLQVRMLRGGPDFNQTIAELLGIIPRPPSVPDFATVNLNLRVRRDGERVTATWRAAGGIPGARAATLQVDRGNGVWETLQSGITISRFEDHHPQPVQPCTWVYGVFLTDASGTRISSIFHAAITVGANL